MVLLPNAILRQNMYYDPKKPVIVEPSLKVIGVPKEKSPVMFTTDFALTYHTILSDIESSNIDFYLIVVDTGGIAVDSAVAGRKLTAGEVARVIKESKIVKKIKHRELIIPGKAARLAEKIEEITKWTVIIGPRDSSDLPKFLEDKMEHDKIEKRK